MTRQPLLGAPLLALLLIPVQANAGNITGISAINNSPDYVVAQAFHVTQLITSVSAGAASANGLDVSFSTHFRFAFGDLVAAGGPEFGLITLNQLIYEVHFTVDDPGNVGYHLQMDTLLRGFIEGRVDGTSSPPSPFVDPSVHTDAASMTGYFDDGSGSGFVGPVGQLALFGTSDHADGVGASFSDERLASASFSAGDFIGTRNFAVLFSPAPSYSFLTIMNNYTKGEAGLRYGAHTTQSGLTFDTPGPDGVPADDLGHFLTVTASFSQSETPEPASYMLYGAGLAAVGLFRRRQRARNL
jgi:hypothetical protein